MKTIRISIEQMENLLGAAKLRKDQRPTEYTNIVTIQQISPYGSPRSADKLRFYLESARTECYDHFLGTNQSQKGMKKTKSELYDINTARNEWSEITEKLCRFSRSEYEEMFFEVPKNGVRELALRFIVRRLPGFYVSRTEKIRGRFGWCSIDQDGKRVFIRKKLAGLS